MTGSFQFSLLFSCMKGIYILLLNKAYSQLTLGYSRTTALILVTAPILFIYSVECHRGVAPVPPQTFVYKSLTKNFIFYQLSCLCGGAEQCPASSWRLCAVGELFAGSTRRRVLKLIFSI